MLQCFEFLKFKVMQDHCAMKVGTDGVLLGAWARGGRHVLDIGSGTGLLCLMMAQRFAGALVEGVEMDDGAALQSMANAKASPFAQHIVIHHSRLQDFKPSASFDAMVTNPPFFIGGVAAPQAARNAARHTVEMTFADIMAFAAQHLSSDGHLSAVLPSDVLSSFEMEASARGFFLSRLTDVCTRQGKKPKRCLVEFSRQRPCTLDRQSVGLLNERGEKTPWYEQLTSDFYIR